VQPPIIIAAVMDSALTNIIFFILIYSID